jgi:hypothetical protein
MVDTPTIAAEQIEVAARAKGVLVAVFGAHRIRLVTHLDVEETAQRGGQIVAEVIETLQRLHGE